MDYLVGLTLFLSSSKEEPAKIVAGNVLRSLNEYKIRKACGEIIYRVGLQVYSHNRVSEKTFADNSLFGRMDVGRKALDPGRSNLSNPPLLLRQRTQDLSVRLVTASALRPARGAFALTWLL